ncbi:MAG TPA: hypothetical protein VGR00_04245 [Thermoanaerobaculia bacterium]|nr:hypothetical protein [Thermoanaerobaculia bacterium]
MNGTVPKTLLEPLPLDRLGTGLCPEAQGDGVPCEVVGNECERCGHRRRAVGEELGGILMSDGLYSSE